MIDVNDLRKGVTFEYDNQLFKVLDYHHNKSGRGNASIRIKARNIRTGTTLEKTFISGDRVQDVRLDFHNVQYSYNDSNFYYFMDLENFDQHALPKALVSEVVDYLKENLEVKLTFFSDEPLDIELPTSVDLLVTQASVAVRGDTATGVNKRVTVETGYQVDVPNFVKEGDIIRIDTRTGSYVTRVTD
jgi:elongation factor P